MLLGIDYGNSNITAFAQAALPRLFVDLVSRGSARIGADLSGATILPGVWSSTVGFTLSPGAAVTFNGLGNPDSTFVLCNTGEFRFRFSASVLGQARSADL